MSLATCFMTVFQRIWIQDVLPFMERFGYITVPKCIVLASIHPCIDRFPSIKDPEGRVAECCPRSITLNDNSLAKYVLWPAESNSLLMMLASCSCCLKPLRTACFAGNRPLNHTKSQLLSKEKGGEYFSALVH